MQQIDTNRLITYHLFFANNQSLALLFLKVAYLEWTCCIDRDATVP